MYHSTDTLCDKRLPALTARTRSRKGVSLWWFSSVFCRIVQYKVAENFIHKGLKINEF